MMNNSNSSNAESTMAKAVRTALSKDTNDACPGDGDVSGAISNESKQYRRSVCSTALGSDLQKCDVSCLSCS